MWKSQWTDDVIYERLFHKDYKDSQNTSTALSTAPSFPVLTLTTVITAVTLNSVRASGKPLEHVEKLNVS